MPGVRVDVACTQVSLFNKNLEEIEFCGLDKATVEALLLGKNSLKRLPDGLGRLTMLQTLGVSNNQLTFLPPAIGDLKNLRRLWVHNNRLTSLPPEIGALPKLSELKCQNNCLTELPPTIGGLPLLLTLNVNDNQLETFPSTVSRLSDDAKITARNNPLGGLPASVLDGGVPSLREHFGGPRYATERAQADAEIETLVRAQRGADEAAAALVEKEKLAAEMEAKAVARARNIEQRIQQEAQSPFDASHAALAAKRAAAADAFLFGGSALVVHVQSVKKDGRGREQPGGWSSRAVWARVRCFISDSDCSACQHELVLTPITSPSSKPLLRLKMTDVAGFHYRPPSSHETATARHRAMLVLRDPLWSHFQVTLSPGGAKAVSKGGGSALLTSSSSSLPPPRPTPGRQAGTGMQAGAGPQIHFSAISDWSVPLWVSGLDRCWRHDVPPEIADSRRPITVASVAWGRARHKMRRLMVANGYRSAASLFQKVLREGKGCASQSLQEHWQNVQCMDVLSSGIPVVQLWAQPNQNKLQRTAATLRFDEAHSRLALTASLAAVGEVLALGSGQSASPPSAPNSSTVSVPLNSVYSVSFGAGPGSGGEEEGTFLGRRSILTELGSRCLSIKLISPLSPSAVPQCRPPLPLATLDLVALTDSAAKDTFCALQALCIRPSERLSRAGMLWRIARMRTKESALLDNQKGGGVASMLVAVLRANGGRSAVDGHDLRQQRQRQQRMLEGVPVRCFRQLKKQPPSLSAAGSSPGCSGPPPVVVSGVAGWGFVQLGVADFEDESVPASLCVADPARKKVQDRINLLNAVSFHVGWPDQVILKQKARSGLFSSSTSSSSSSSSSAPNSGGGGNGLPPPPWNCVSIQLPTEIMVIALNCEADMKTFALAVSAWALGSGGGLTIGSLLWQRCRIRLRYSACAQKQTMKHFLATRLRFIPAMTNSMAEETRGQQAAHEAKQAALRRSEAQELERERKQAEARFNGGGGGGAGARRRRGRGGGAAAAASVGSTETVVPVQPVPGSPSPIAATSSSSSVPAQLGAVELTDDEIEEEARQRAQELADQRQRLTVMLRGSAVRVWPGVYDQPVCTAFSFPEGQAQPDVSYPSTMVWLKLSADHSELLLGSAETRKCCPGSSCGGLDQSGVLLSNVVRIVYGRHGPDERWCMAGTASRLKQQAAGRRASDDVLRLTLVLADRTAFSCVFLDQSTLSGFYDGLWPLVPIMSPSAGSGSHYSRLSAGAMAAAKLRLLARSLAQERGVRLSDAWSLLFDRAVRLKGTLLQKEVALAWRAAGQQYRHLSLVQQGVLVYVIPSSTLSAADTRKPRTLSEGYRSAVLEHGVAGKPIAAMLRLQGSTLSLEPVVVGGRMWPFSGEAAPVWPDSTVNVSVSARAVEYHPWSLELAAAAAPGGPWASCRGATDASMREMLAGLFFVVYKHKSFMSASRIGIVAAGGPGFGAPMALQACVMTLQGCCGSKPSNPKDAEAATRVKALAAGSRAITAGQLLWRRAARLLHFEGQRHKYSCY